MKEWEVRNPGQGVDVFKGTHLTMPNREHPYVVISGENNSIVAIIHLAPGGWVGLKQEQ